MIKLNNLICAAAQTLTVWSLLNSRSGDDRGVDDMVLVLVWWSPAGSLPPVLMSQSGVVDRLLRQGRTLCRLSLCRQTGVRVRVRYIRSDVRMVG